MAQLVCPSTRPAALAASALASLVELIKDVLTVTHKSGRLPDRFALVNLLSKLALVSSDPRHTSVLQYLEYALLIPRRRVGRMLMQEQSAFRQLLEIQFAYPRQVNPPRLLLRLNNLGVVLLVVDELPSTEICTHGSAHQQNGFLLIQQFLRLDPHARPGEIPWFAILVWHCKVQCQPKCDAIAR